MKARAAGRRVTSGNMLKVTVHGGDMREPEHRGPRPASVPVSETAAVVLADAGVGRRLFAAGCDVAGMLAGSDLCGGHGPF